MKNRYCESQYRQNFRNIPVNNFLKKPVKNLYFGNVADSQHTIVKNEFLYSYLSEILPTF